MWARWTTMSRRVFYSPFWRRNSKRIAPSLFGQPCLFLQFLYYYYSFRSQAFHVEASMKISSPSWFWLAPLRWFDFHAHVRRCSTILLCSIGFDWCSPLEPPCLFYVVILIFSGATLASTLPPTWSSFIVPALVSIVSAYVWFSSLD